MTTGAQKPRVLIIATRVPLQSGDGTPSFVLDNASALADEFDITILAPRVRGSLRESQQGGITIKRFAYFPSRWERIADEAIMPQLGANRMLWIQALSMVGALLVRALKEGRENSPDVVHAHWILPSGLAALAMHRLFGTPYLITSQGADAFRMNRQPLLAVKRAVLNRSARFIGVSNEITERFPALQCPVEAQPSGVDFSFWGRIAEMRMPEPGRVLFVGRLAAKKGVADAIRAVAQLDDVQLRVAGEGPLEAELKELASSTVGSERVRFLGRCTRSEVAEEMRTAMCIVIPSITADDGDRDGTPNVLGEAIGASVPVIGSRIAGIAEFVVDRETGLLHEPGDIHGLAVALRAMMSSPEVASQIAHSALTRFTEQFDIERVSQRYDRWYREAIAASRHASER